MEEDGVMRRLHGILKGLAANTTELRTFLNDPDAWIEHHASALSEAEREELRRVASDLASFLELRCIQMMDRSPEARFVRGRPIERRKFMFQGASLLAGMLAGICVGPPTALARSTEDQTLAADTNCENHVFCMDSGETCIDNSCTNEGLCQDGDNCSDVDCTNTGICDDVSGCTDRRCDNDTKCTDSTCSDKEICDNSGSGSEQNCHDNSCGDWGTCTNQWCDDDAACNDQTCNDSWCENEPTCLNDTNCTDTSLCSDTGTCVNALACDDQSICSHG